MNKILIYLFLLTIFLIFLLSCNSDSNNDDSNQITPTTPTTPTTPEEVTYCKSYTDTTDEFSNSFIDLTEMSFNIENNVINISMSVKNLPSQLVFNHDSLSENTLNYKWEVLFDVNKDGISSKNDITMSIYKFKHPDSSEIKEDILTATQKNVWLISDTGGSNLGEITASISDNTFNLSVSKSSYSILNTINCDVPVQFTTMFYNGIILEKDNYIANLNQSNRNHLGNMKIIKPTENYKNIYGNYIVLKFDSIL